MTISPLRVIDVSISYGKRIESLQEMAIDIFFLSPCSSFIMHTCIEMFLSSDTCIEMCVLSVFSFTTVQADSQHCAVVVSAISVYGSVCDVWDCSKGSLFPNKAEFTHRTQCLVATAAHTHTHTYTVTTCSFLLDLPNKVVLIFPLALPFSLPHPPFRCCLHNVCI